MTSAMPPAICISCPHTDAASLMSDPEICYLRDQTPHLFELRLDRINALSVAALRAIVTWFGAKRLVITYRSAQEGGQAGASARMSDRQRLRLLELAAGLGPLYLDLELADVQRLPDRLLRLRKFRRAHARLIISVHLQSAVPDLYLQQQRDLAQAYGADLIKIILVGTTFESAFQALRFARAWTALGTPLLTFATGPLGQFTRLLSDCGHAPPPLVFACLHGRPPVAPGQLPWQTMQRAYRIARPTQIYGVIGSPVAHSLSPAWHQDAFIAQGDPARYIPCEVPRGKLKVFLTLAKQVFTGFSVTMPHKVDAAALAAECSTMVSRTAVANTLRLGPDELWVAENTDAPAVYHWLRQAVPSDSATLSVLVVGTGGFAASVIEAACTLRARIYICGRNKERLDYFTKNNNVTAIEKNAVASLPLTLIVNATPLGMPGPLSRETCLSLNALTRDIVLLDGVYQGDPMTPWLRHGQSLGHPVVTGFSLFCEQANLQRKFWGKNTLSSSIAGGREQTLTF